MGAWADIRGRGKWELRGWRNVASGGIGNCEVGGSPRGTELGFAGLAELRETRTWEWWVRRNSARDGIGNGATGGGPRGA